MELVKVMTDGTCKAMGMHAQEKGITLTEEMINKTRQAVKDEWNEFTDTLKDATEANMGEAMYKQIMNVYCNSWAVKAIKNS